MNDSELIEKKISSEDIFSGNIVHLFKDTVELSNGTTATREYVKHPGAVCIVPLTDDWNVIAERQFRYPHNKIIYEIPAGKIDMGENPLNAAKRELSEETGYKAKDFIYLGELYTSPAILDEIIYMYAATGLTKEEQHTDDDEFIDIIEISLENMVKLIMDGKIPDAKTQAAVLRTYLSLQN